MKTKRKKKVVAPRSAPMIYVGAQAEAIQEARVALVEILKVEAAGDAAKIAAFDALKHLCAVGNTSISNCNFESV